MQENSFHFDYYNLNNDVVDDGYKIAWKDKTESIFTAINFLCNLNEILL